MDEHEREEINRIQEDIDKILKPAQEGAERDAGAAPETDNITEDDGASPFGETARAVSPSPSAPAYEEADRLKSNGFYTEVIKKDPPEDINRKKNARRRFLSACAMVAIGCLFIGGGIGVGYPLASRVLVPRMLGHETAVSERDPFYFADAPRPEFEAKSYTLYDDNLSAIVSMVEPSVVGVTTISQPTASNYFFSPQREYPYQASGIIFHQDEDNVYIVTNYHVISGASIVTVSVSGGEPVNARLIGSESDSDIAVIAIRQRDLSVAGVEYVSVAAFGDSDGVLVGETVLAIGNALGEGNTATRGIISAKNKEIEVASGIVLTVLQTDAAINPGNSGGPLVNTKGEVVGINTAKIRDTQVEGTGYSITSNVAKVLVENLMNQKERPFLGVRMENLTKEYAEMYNIPEMGVLILEVIEDSSADVAGIKRLDVITGFNDEPVLTTDDLRRHVSGCEIGDEVEIKLFRDGRTAMTIKVIMRPNPEAGNF